MEELMGKRGCDIGCTGLAEVEVHTGLDEVEHREG